MMTPEAALALYRKGPNAVVRVLVDQSATVDALQQRGENLQQQVEALKRPYSRRTPSIRASGPLRMT